MKHRDFLYSFIRQRTASSLTLLKNYIILFMVIIMPKPSRAKHHRNKHPATTLVAISLAALSLFWLFAWRDLSVYFQYRRGNTKTATAQCVSVSADQTNELRSPTVFTIYCLNLDNGVSTAIYKETADKLLRQKRVPEQTQALERQFVTGEPITVVYVEKPALVNNTYALMSVSNDGETMIDATTHYSSRAKTMIIMNSILYGLALLILASPWIAATIKKLRRRKA